MNESLFIDTIPLCDIAVNERATVSQVDSDGEMRQRFLDIGLTNGAEVVCVGQSPSGDPHAYLIRGAVIAIRKKDAKSILVTRK